MLIILVDNNKSIDFYYIFKKIKYNNIFNINFIKINIKNIIIIYFNILIIQRCSRIKNKKNLIDYIKIIIHL